MAKIPKILNVILKVVLCLILLMPILGVLGVFPPPTPDLYNSPEAYMYIDALMKSKIINPLMAIIFAAAIVLIAMNRTALAAIIILPVTVNIVLFHLVLDGGLHKVGAQLGNLLLALNIQFLWQHRRQYLPMWEKGRGRARTSK